MLPATSFVPRRGLPSTAAAALWLAAAWPLGARADAASEAELARRLDRLAAELAAVKAELALLQRGSAPPGAVAAPAASAPAVANGGPVVIPAAPPAEPATVLGGYAELNYNRPDDRARDTQADLRRLVVGLQHRFDERTRLATEIEIEHAVSSADDDGEVAVEQAYVEHQLAPAWAVRGGLFLMPLGLLNESHEPTAYYGVERNYVETAIIPTTWREGGLQAIGSFGEGLTLQAGVSTGFDLSKWDATSEEGRESPLGAVHQELALANARDLALFGALNWRGVPGLQFGGGVFSGKSTQGQVRTDARITLWDLHARWTPGRWDLAALYARGDITNTAALNLPLVGNPVLIPKRFDGGYLQAAYRLWRSGTYEFAPFVRWERFDTARRYADLGPGLTPQASGAERVWTFGANFAIAEGVVLKADLQRADRDRAKDRFDLGLGWSF